MFVVNGHERGVPTRAQRRGERLDIDVGPDERFARCVGFQRANDAANHGVSVLVAEGSYQHVSHANEL